ncbi:MFS transporter [Streptomyces sp. K1PN6]|uniref:MFS transporter n=1 Tax=Streptomyces acidicola TaxID=2596892 RepID=A0A5N8WML4_9ACTN|nr:MFS transporter [Streptomyces acidicola]
MGVFWSRLLTPTAFQPHSTVCSPASDHWDTSIPAETTPIPAPALLALAISAFGIGTAEFVMMGLLPNVADDGFERLEFFYGTRLCRPQSRRSARPAAVKAASNSSRPSAKWARLS